MNQRGSLMVYKEDTLNWVKKKIKVHLSFNTVGCSENCAERQIYNIEGIC